MLTWKRILLALILLIAGLFAFVGLALPGIVKNQAQQWVAEHTGRTLQISELTINPFLLTVDIHDLVLSEPGEENRFVAWDNLHIAISPRSIRHFAPILREIRLTRPFVHIERLEMARFNFSDLIPSPGETKPPRTDDEPSRFSLNNMVIEDGRIELIDRSVAKPQTHTVRDLDLAVPFLGNLPYLVEKPVQPAFSAVINESRVALQGRLTPFAETPEFSLELALHDIDLPDYLGYLPMELPVVMGSGRLGFDLELLYRASETQKPELEISGEIFLTALELRDPTGAPLLFLPLLRADLAPSRPLDKQVHLASLDIYDLESHVSRNAGGQWNFARLQIPPREQEEEAGKQEEEAAEIAFQLTLDRFRLRDGILHFNDQQPAGGFRTTARKIMIDFTDLAVPGEAAVPLTASLTTDHQEQLSLDGRLFLQPFAMDIDLQADNLPLAVYQPYYQDWVAVRPGGVLEAAANLVIDPATPLAVRQGRLDLQRLNLPLAEPEGLNLERLLVEGVAYELAGNRLQVNSVQATRGDLRFSRQKNGQLSLLSPNYPVLMPSDEPPPAPASARKPAADAIPAFRYQIGEIALRGWSIDFTDQQPSEDARFELTGFGMQLDDLTGPDGGASPFSLQATLNQTGDIKLSGTLAPTRSHYRIDSQLRRLPLTALAPYISDQTDIILEEGRFDANLKTDLTLQPEGVRASFGGDLGIENLQTLDALHREDLVKWNSFQAAGIDGRWAPLELSIASVTMSDYYAKVLIDESARLNLVQAFRKGAAEEPAQKEEEAATGQSGPAAEAPAPSALPYNVKVSRVTLQGGQVDFTDRHLTRPFHADMRQLGGSIQGLDSAAGAKATVDLRGKLRNQSPLVIEGVVNPFGERFSLDLDLNFNDIEMSPMSPYSGTYLGYLIEKGKLNLALNYQVEGQQLQASNAVFLDQFSFGEPVESDRAIGLPVKLAVALLKDRSGEIHLDIPVSGDLGNPQFSIAGVIWTVIKNLLVKAATSPLALLGALVPGGGGEDFSSLAFAPGTQELGPEQQAKLSNLAEALVKRPALILEIRGYIDPENDPEGYRRQQLREKIMDRYRRDRKAPQEGQTTTTEDKVPLSDEQYSAYLWEVYKHTDFPKPRNFIGMLEHLPDEEMKKLIYTNTAVGEEELSRLAQQRAQSVRNYLVEQGNVPAERIFLVTPDIDKPPEKDNVPASRVEFDVNVK